MKKINFWVILPVLSAMFAAGCSQYLNYRDSMLRIQPGMTKDRVLNILGKPAHRSFDPETEEWIYYPGGTDTTKITFEDGRVKSMKTFLRKREEHVPYPPGTREGYPYGFYGHNEAYERNIRHRNPAHRVPSHEFELMLNDIRDESFDEDKLKMVMSISVNRSFDTNQIALILQCFSWDKNRIKALYVLGEKMLVTDNYRRIVDTFDFMSEKQKAERFLRDKINYY